MIRTQTHWWQGSTVCSICGYRQQTVIEIDKDLNQPFVPMECGSCGNMTCHPEENE